MRLMSKTIEVCEIFKSLQGESTHAGRICTFVRLSGCNLRCSYCDTIYAHAAGIQWDIFDVVEAVRTMNCQLVEITGGEPLLQLNTPRLCEELIACGHTVLVETNGSLDISGLPSGCIRIIDVKTPDSGESESFLLRNIEVLSSQDEVKFVISSRTDFEWACRFAQEHKLVSRCTVLLSPNTQCLSVAQLADWIIDADIPMRLGIQLHKTIWGDDAKGR